MARSSRSQKTSTNAAVDLRPEQRRLLELEVRIGDTIVHRSPPSVARSLRYLLSGGNLPDRVSVTSSIQGEGVTAISRTLASLIANDWQARTCWIDLNWWKSKSETDESTLFDVTLAKVLDGTGRASDLAVQTSLANLSMVSAGEIPVSSRFKVPRDERLAKVLTDLSNTFDYLIVDLPPILVASDAVSLAGLTDGYLLVVRQRATTTAQVGAALEAMTTVPCLGSILNGARTRVPRWLLSSNEMWALTENG